jgi:3-methyladenine DNA glycosylase AlkD
LISVNRLELDRITRNALRSLRRESIPARRAFMKGYAPTEMKILGVPVPAMRRVMKDVKRKLEAESANAVLAVGRGLVGTNVSEAGIVAYELVASRSDALERVGEREILRLGRGLDNWAAVDAFSVVLLGPAWRRRQIKDAFIVGWARSRDRWRRRAAVVATVALNQRSRGGEGDPKRTLRICELVARDQDDMVAKGLSWALRALSVRDPKAVRGFLKKHGDTLPARVRREVRSKLETGYKNPTR